MRKRALIIDGNPRDRDLAAAWLRASGYEVQSAGGGGPGLKLATAHPPDVIVLDLHLPDMNGYEVCRLVRGASETRRIPIIVITASDDAALHSHVFAAGAQACVPKPVRREGLIAAIEVALAAARRRTARPATAKYSWRQQGLMPSTRQFVRFPVTLPAIGWTAQFPGEAIEGVVRDISDGGMMAELAVELTTGSAVDLVLDTRRGPLDVKGRVVWASGSEGIVRHGVAFLRPRASDFARSVFVGESH